MTCVWEIAIYGVKVVVEKSECNAALTILHYTDYVLVKPSFLWLHSGTMANIVTKGVVHKCCNHIFKGREAMPL